LRIIKPIPATLRLLPDSYHAPDVNFLKCDFTQPIGFKPDGGLILKNNLPDVLISIARFYAVQGGILILGNAGWNNEINNRQQ
jgi:hypothetical protein